MRFELDDLRDGYRTIANAVLTHGTRVAPRGIPTLELLSADIILKNPAASIPVGINRKLNLAIGAAESCQLLGGVCDAAQLVSIAPSFLEFIEKDRFRGAYGPRTYRQFPNVVSSLTQDRDTRQAGVVIWRDWDIANPSKNVPCTLELHFMIRDDKLDMHVTMRSNDVFWGLAYDAWVFTNVQHAVSYAIKVPVGTYYHHAYSLHIYERDVEKIEALTPYDGKPSPPMFVGSYAEFKNTDAMDRWSKISYWARVSLGRSKMDSFLPDSVAWHAEKLKLHPSTGILCPSCRYVLPKNRHHFKLRKNSDERGFLACRRCSVARRHDLSPDEFEALWIIQDGRCGICRKERDLVVDHDHTSNRTRGLLCRPCNVAIGLLNEDAQPMIEYLSSPPFESNIVPKIGSNHLRTRNV